MVHKYFNNRARKHLINSGAEQLQLCTINKNTQASLLSPEEEAIRSAQYRQRTSLCAYYLARHKTTGARGWMSILCILVLVYTPLTVLKNLSLNHSDPTAPDLSSEQRTIYRLSTMSLCN